MKRFSSSFRDLRFFYKVIALPLLSAVAFIIVLGSLLSTGERNKLILAEIESGHFPALMIRRDLEEGLAAIQRGLQDAAAAEDEDILAETDVLKERILDATASL